MLDLFTLDFAQRALLAGLIIAIVCPMVGLFLVLRRLALYGDTLAHVSLAGAAVALVTRSHSLLMTLAFSVGASLGLDWLRRSNRWYGDLSLAVTLSAFLGLAVLLFSMDKGSATEVSAFLFGSVLTVTAQDLLLMAGVGAVVVLLVGLLYADLFALTFDEEHARISGRPVRLVEIVFLVAAAVVAAITMRVVGALLVSSLLVLPAATALQLARSFLGAVVWAIVTGILAMGMGLMLAFWLNLAPGGMVVLAAVAIQLAVVGWKRIRGIE